MKFLSWLGSNLTSLIVSLLLAIVIWISAATAANPIVEADLDIHVVHLGTMGVYGYGTVGLEVPEGYLQVFVEVDGEKKEMEISQKTRGG